MSDRVSDSAPDTGPDTLPQLLKIADVAAIFGRDPRTVRRWIARGLLVPVCMGRSRFIRANDVRDIISGEITDRILGGR